jgi:hypothetical protein
MGPSGIGIRTCRVGRPVSGGAVLETCRSARKGMHLPGARVEVSSNDRRWRPPASCMHPAIGTRTAAPAVGTSINSAIALQIMER